MANLPPTEWILEIYGGDIEELFGIVAGVWATDCGLLLTEAQRRDLPKVLAGMFIKAAEIGTVNESRKQLAILSKSIEAALNSLQELSPSSRTILESSIMDILIPDWHQGRCLLDHTEELLITTNRICELALDRVPTKRGRQSREAEHFIASDLRTYFASVEQEVKNSINGVFTKCLAVLLKLLALAQENDSAHIIESLAELLKSPDFKLMISLESLDVDRAYERVRSVLEPR